MSPRNASAYEVRPGDAMAPGAFYFLHRYELPSGRIGVVHACPCGCGGKSALFFRGMGGGRQEWDVVGEWPKVTLTPSIGIKYDGETGERSQYHWHGFLEDGVFVER